MPVSLLQLDANLIEGEPDKIQIYRKYVKIRETGLQSPPKHKITTSANYTDVIGTGYTSHDKELCLHYFKINQLNSYLFWCRDTGGGVKKWWFFPPQRSKDLGTGCGVRQAGIGFCFLLGFQKLISFSGKIRHLPFCHSFKICTLHVMDSIIFFPLFFLHPLCFADIYWTINQSL